MPDKPADKPERSDEQDSGTRYRNVAGRPLVYDGDGHQLDAGGVSDPVELDETGQAALDAGLLQRHE